MNEAKQRIDELFEQAGGYFGEQGEPVLPDIEKFAELIIQKCMACSTWVGKNNTNTVEPMHTAQAINQRIKNQFGIEQ